VLATIFAAVSVSWVALARRTVAARGRALGSGAIATHYERLGVPPSASADDLRAAYRRLARQHHPDAHGGRTSPDMAALNEAWYVLRDPGRRALYDAALRPVAPPSAGSTAERVDEEEPVQPTGHLGIPIGWIAILAALAIIFVFTAYAASSTKGSGSDGQLRPGECVAIDGEGFAVETSCTRAHDGVVQGLVPFDTPCPNGSSSYTDRTHVSQVCVRS
jgi:hypothetical protein